MGAFHSWRPLTWKQSSVEAVVEAALDPFLSSEPPSVTTLHPPTHCPRLHFFPSSSSSPARAQSHFSGVNPLQLVGHVDICPETQRSGQSSAGNRLGSARIHHASAGSSPLLRERGCMARMTRSVSCRRPCIQIRPCWAALLGRLTDVSYLDL